jgi:hypothetical protein
VASFTKADMRAIFERGMYLGMQLPDNFDAEEACEAFFGTALERIKDAKAAKPKDEMERLFQKWYEAGCPKEGFVSKNGIRQTPIDFSE